MYTPMYGHWGGYGGGKGKGKGKSMQYGKGQIAGGPPVTGAHFGHFGAGQSQKGDSGGPPGNVAGGKGGWVNGMGPFAPPNSATVPGGQAASLWRGGRRSRQKQSKADKDAACAAELAAVDLESLASVSEVGDSGKCFGAARHHAAEAQRLQHVCPEAAAVCFAKSQAFQQRGQDALPLSHQVATLERQYKAKVSEAERLRGQLHTLSAQLEGVVQAGLVVRGQLAEARAKVAATPPTSPPVAVVPPGADAFQFFLQSASLLPPDQAGLFGACLETIQRALLADAHPVAPAPMDVGPTPPGEQRLASGVEPANLAVPSGTDEVEFPADWLERQHAEAESSTTAAPPAPAERGRSLALARSPPTRRGSAPPPLVARSRSNTAVRSRQPRSDADAFIDEGTKYFSHAAERAGLDDV